MGFSVSPVKRFKSGNMFVNMVDIAVDGTDEYPAGGYVISPAKLGLNVVHGATCENLDGYKLIYNTSTSKLMAFQYPDTPAGPAAELANESTALRDKTLQVIAMGR